jgi:hypothetical protein
MYVFLSSKYWLLTINVKFVTVYLHMLISTVPSRPVSTKLPQVDSDFRITRT